MTLRCLNLGCGGHHLAHWVNVDFSSTAAGVIAHNLTAGIPFPEQSFDVVYHSHVLEHFTREQGEFFMKECFRVLKSNGIVRVLVPDLETIASEYLKNLAGALRGDGRDEQNYDWIVLELLDQTARNAPGGNMAAYWRQPRIGNADYVHQRMGAEFSNYRKNLQTQQQQQAERGTPRNAPSLWDRAYLKSAIRRRLLQWLQSDEQAAQQLEVGKFRLGGEIHQFMYDRFSLQRLLRRSGFSQIKQVTAATTALAGFDDFKWLDLDIETERKTEKEPETDTDTAQARRPDSLFMEGFR